MISPTAAHPKPKGKHHGVRLQEGIQEFYLPPKKPGIVTVPPMSYLAVRGHGDPNAEGGEYRLAIELLYGVAYTIKMSKRSDHRIDGYFDFVVPPLEGLWWQEGAHGVDYARKEDFDWVSLIRLPDFVTADEVAWAKAEAAAKKGRDFGKVGFFAYDEGLCVQCLHVGPYDDEPTTVEAMHAYMEAQGYALDIADERHHHEIYLSDARRVAPERLRTVVRHPIKITQEDGGTVPSSHA